MEYIKVKIRTGSADGERTKSATVYNIESSCPGLSTFELPKLMHALSISKNLIKENSGFPYTLPFEL